MIIVDYSNILHKAVHSYKSKPKGNYRRSYNRNQQVPPTELTLSILRHSILNQILKLKKMYSEKYGRLVIALDGQNNWRYKEFEYYKARRKLNRKTSSTNWPQIYEWSKIIEEELATEFQYQVLKVNQAEADDIIAVLALETMEKTLVASMDSDMTQLLVNDNVTLFSLKTMKEVTCEEPLKILVEGIVRGQKGKDDIPNILSPIDSFVHKIKQKPITQKFIQRALTESPKSFCETDEIYDRYVLNRMLIDMRYIPDYIVEDIKNEIAKPYKSGKKPKLYKFFMKKGLAGQMSNLDAFLEK